MTAPFRPKPEDMEAPDFEYPEINGYTFQGHLGRGIWTSVGLYEQERTHKLFACKFYAPNAYARILQEGREQTIDDIFVKETLGDNTKPIEGIAYNTLEGLEDGTPFLREEYLDRFLHKFLEDNTPSLDEIVHIAKGIAVGLRNMHIELKKAYQDCVPKNIAYTTDKRVVLSDFGNATTCGMDRQNAGYWLARPPERLEKGPADFKDDIWCFGNTLYFIFTGKYIMQDDVEKADNPEELIKALYQDSARWNGMVIEPKLKDKRIPKIFRPLLRRCLYGEYNRFNNGAELLADVEKLERDHKRSKPMSRLKRWGLTAAAALMIWVGTAKFVQTNYQKDDLTAQLEAAQTDIGLEKKLRTIRLYQEGTRYSDNWTDHTNLQELDGWVDLFGDEFTGFAAYLDANPKPLTVYKAIQMNNGKTDFKLIAETLEELNPDLYYETWEFSIGGTDNVARLVGNERRKKVRQTWKETEVEARDEVNRLLLKYHRLEEGINNAKNRKNPGGMASGALDYSRVLNQKEVIQQLSQWTGKDPSTLRTLIEEGSRITE